MKPSKEKLIKTLLVKKELWNRYALANYKKNKKIDLRNADLSCANLRKANLRNADLSNADLSYANLRNADLRNADLSNADLSYANLRNADLSNANLSYADLRNADLSNADLSKADLDYSQWQLSCKTLSVKMTSRIFCQLLYHAAKPNYVEDDNDIKELLKNDLFLKVCNKFHLAGKLGNIE